MSWMRRVFHVPASETQMGLVLALCIFTMSVMSIALLMAGPGHRQAERRHSHARNAFRRLIGSLRTGKHLSPFPLFPLTFPSLCFNPSCGGNLFREIAREPLCRCILAFFIFGAGIGRATPGCFNNRDKQSHPAPFASPQNITAAKIIQASTTDLRTPHTDLFSKPSLKRKKGPQPESEPFL